MKKRAWLIRLAGLVLILAAAVLFASALRGAGGGALFPQGPSEGSASAAGEESRPAAGASSDIHIEIVQPTTTAPEAETYQAEAETETGGDGSGGPADPGGKPLMDITPKRLVSPETVEYLGVDSFFWQEPLDDETFARIYGKSYKEECTVPRENLRYLQMLHYDLDGNIHIGEMISNRQIADVLLTIFRKLYDARYPIEKMVLVDDYNADDEASSADNNTSCFNYRRVIGSSGISRHAQGMAVNINPLYNPYIYSGYNTGGEMICTPVPGQAYLDRTQEFPYKIDEDDLATKLFKEAGFTWGGDWKTTPDYMHFDLR